MAKKREPRDEDFNWKLAEKDMNHHGRGFVMRIDVVDEPENKKRRDGRK